MANKPWRRLFSIALWGCCGTAFAHEVAPAITVLGSDASFRYAASDGSISEDELDARPATHPGKLLEAIPGMVVTQHSGGGKANQFFLRGMNLDHGTDFSTSVDGVPVNLPSHAHGQGYSDLNFVIPELISRIDYRKGPYAAADGDFSSAGAADMVYRRRLAAPVASVLLGQGGYRRGLLASSTALSADTDLLAAVEYVANDGPWAVPEGLQRLNAHLGLTGGQPTRQWRIALDIYDARWTATDQIPRRLLMSGQYLDRPFGRFDSLNPTDGGASARVGLHGEWQVDTNMGAIRAHWYAVRYSLDLFSDFTYFTARAVRPEGDQFGQRDRRVVLGGDIARSWLLKLGDDRWMQSTVGLQLRRDHVRAGLYDTAERTILNTVRDDDISQTLLGLYASNETGWNRWLRTVTGIRADRAGVDVDGRLPGADKGRAESMKVSPKVTVIFGPWQQTELFASAGRGFHSNDARGATARTDPRTGEAVGRAPLLVSSRGREIGIRSLLLPGLETAVAIWQLDLDSELVFAGDAGTTEPGRASQRTGIEWVNRWQATEVLVIDANLAWTRPRYKDQDPAGDRIPNAVERVADLSARVSGLGPWGGSLGARYIGSAPLVEDGSTRSRPSFTVNLRVVRRLSNHLEAMLDVLNLTDRKNDGISYFYPSRLPGEPPGGVPDVHLHPAEPRTVLLGLRATF